MLVVALVVVFATCAQSLNNGLGLTPPMGWLAWERFRCNIDCKNDPNNCISEKLFMDMADRMVEDGYRDVGYEYVNIDDCWSNKTRDSLGRLQADGDRFPHGIKYLADYMHKRGLKLGIYGDYGTKTCGGYPGSVDYLQVDADTFADWGVDMLKLDGCNADPRAMDKGYPEMTKYLNATGRPILFSCSWPDYQRAEGLKINYTSIADNCNIWRNYDDIQDSWASVTSIIKYYGTVQDQLIPLSAPGQFNDPDMIIVGNNGLNMNQSNAQMAMWAVMASPLLMSNDLRNIQPAMRAVLQNKEVIEINQDPLGIMGSKLDLGLGPDVEVWQKRLDSWEAYALVFLNRRNRTRTISVTLRQLGLTFGAYQLRDVINHKNYVYFRPSDQAFDYMMPATGVLMLQTTGGE